MTRDGILGARRRIARQLDEALCGRLDVVPTAARRAALTAVLAEALRVADHALAATARAGSTPPSWHRGAWSGLDA